MLSFSIRLTSVSDVRSFVAITEKYDCDIDLVSGAFTVDGKSIMGIFSLNLKEPLEVTIHKDGKADAVCEALAEALKPFKVL